MHNPLIYEGLESKPLLNLCTKGFNGILIAQRWLYPSFQSRQISTPCVMGVISNQYPPLTILPDQNSKIKILLVKYCIESKVTGLILKYCSDSKITGLSTEVL